LDFLVRKYLPSFGGYKAEVDKANLASESLVKVARYNGADSVAPMLLISKLEEEVERGGYSHTGLTQFYRRLIPYVATLESHGVAVDKSRLEEVEIDTLAEIDGAAIDCEKLGPGVNPASPQQVSKYLYETLGLPVPDVKDAVGKSGMPSTREDVVSRIDHAYAKALITLRKAKKIQSTYVEGVKKCLTPSGLIFPEYHFAKTAFGGTVSGRLSCRNPAIQTIPRDSQIRSVFVSRYEGGTLLGIDAAQMELRYAASLSRDPALLEVFLKDEDPHQAMADLCGVDRQVGKNINFAILYDITWHGLVERYGLSPSDAKRVAKTVKSTYVKLFKKFDAVKLEAIHNGEVSTPYGRFRRVPGATPSTGEGRALLREAVNFVIQAPASDMIQVLGWKMMLVLEGLAVPIGSHHDGLLWDIPRGNLDEVLDKVELLLVEFPRLVRNILGMELYVPFKFDLKTGPNWLDMEEI